MSAEEAAANPPKKRKSRTTCGVKGKKKAKVFSRTEGQGKKAKKIDGRMKKLFRKRAREYNSDEDDDNEGNENLSLNSERTVEVESDEEAEEKELESGSEDEGDEMETGVMKFVEGCRAFSLAFNKITKKSVSEDLLGPVLSGHKKLLAEKLAEEEADHKVKADAKKEKNLLREKGHVKPANFLDSHEKFLISVATKGVAVVKLFNGVNKAQIAQKGLNPSRTKDAKALAKRRKAAFLSELHKKPTQDAESSKTSSVAFNVAGGHGGFVAMAVDLFPKTILKGRGGDEDDNYKSLDKLENVGDVEGRVVSSSVVKERKSGRGDELGNTGKHRMIEMARNVFDEMPERNIATCNAMVCGLAAHGHAEGTIELLREMEREKVAPNNVTFIGVLSACCHVGWLKLVLMWQFRGGANSAATKKEDGPGWAPLRDSYMLTSSKLKNWDKMQDANATDDMGKTPQFSSSDED
ncbi:hypothetical protein Syun_021461 [Stephania yunnanensis]|uniref:Pentatricopeptide repeat-containing protein n=1 Tax=Stephania yunnanensis TaxID=152371 RepID=A0AAP0IFM8_9MAGN